MVFNSAGIWFCRYSIRIRRYLISQAFNSAGFSMLQVFKSAGIQSCRYLSLKALFLKVFNSAGIRFWRFSCLQVFNSAGIQFCRYSIPQVFDSAGIQICRFSILQVFDPAGIRAWRHQFCRYSFQRSNVCRCTFCQPYSGILSFYTTFPLSPIKFSTWKVCHSKKNWEEHSSTSMSFMYQKRELSHHYSWIHHWHNFSGFVKNV